MDHREAGIVKVVLVCVYFHSSFGWSIRRALDRAGHEVRVFEYRRNPIQKLSFLGSYFTSTVISRRLLAVCRAFRPTLVLIAKGEVVPGAVVKEIKREIGCRVVNWFPDARLFSYHNVLDQLRFLDAFFGKNPRDLERMKLLGFENGRFLMHCADRELHTGLETPETDLAPYRSEIAFVGSYYPYRDALLSGLSDFDLKIWGSGWDRSELASRRGIIVGREARSTVQAKVFRGAAVNLNLHHYDDTDGLNQRVFDINGSGGCQLTDGDRNVRTVFDVPEEIDVYHSLEELRGKIREILRSPGLARQRGERARRKTESMHTYDHRIAEILSTLRI